MLALSPATAAAQVAPNRATRYLHPTAVTDARAVALNPAGPATVPEASLYFEVSVNDPGEHGRIGQINAGFSSRGLSFGYQRDSFDDVVGHTYRVGLGSFVGKLAAGVTFAAYRGNESATGWDVGLLFTPSRRFVIGGTVMNIGEPEVRGVEQTLTFVPGLTLAPFGPALALSAHANVEQDAVRSYAFGARWSGVPFAPIGALVRVDTDGQLRRAGFAFAIVIGKQNALGAVGTTSADLDTFDGASVHGVFTRRPPR